MSLFCRHNYKPRKVMRGENLRGDVTYAIAFYCIKCDKRRLDKGWSRERAYEQLEWLMELTK